MKKLNLLRLVASYNALDTVLVVADRGCDLTASVDDVTFTSEVYIPTPSETDNLGFEGQMRRLLIPMTAFSDTINSEGNVTVNVSLFDGRLLAFLYQLL